MGYPTNIWTKKCYLDIFQFIQLKFENIKMDPHRFLGPWKLKNHEICQFLAVFSIDACTLMEFWCPTSIAPLFFSLEMQKCISASHGKCRKIASIVRLLLGYCNVYETDHRYYQNQFAIWIWFSTGILRILDNFGSIQIIFSSIEHHWLNYHP